MQTPKTTELKTTAKVDSDQNYLNPGFLEVLLIYVIGVFGLIYALTRKNWSQSTKNTFLFLMVPILIPYGVYYLFAKSDVKAGAKVAFILFLYMFSCILSYGLLQQISYAHTVTLSGSESGEIAIQNILDRTPNNILNTYNEARAFADDGNLEKASSLINTSLKNNPDNVLLVSYGCFLEVELYQADEAVELCSKAFKLSQGRNPYNMTNLAQAYGLQGDCTRVKYFANELYNLRFDSSFSNEVKSTLAGNMGLTMYECFPEDDLTYFYITKAAELTKDQKTIEIYKSYLSNIQNEE